MRTALIASIPSPSFSDLEIGPLTLRMYGLAIALGVIAAVVISSRRWEARGGHPDDIGTIAIWAVPAGVVGARLYHVITDWKTYRDDWGGALDITSGGLGIPGGIALGVLVGYAVVRVRKLPARPLLDVVAPALPVAQAIGRLGNWFNQEVFGRPTSLPWGLEIDPEHRPDRYLDEPTFHPTFLYEGLWNLSLAGVLVLLDRRGRLRPGELFNLYVLGYAVGRLWVEGLRSDEASLILGVRVNIWMSVLVALAAIAVFVWRRRRPAPTDAGPDVGDDAGHDPAERSAGHTAEPADRPADDRRTGAGTGVGAAEGSEPIGAPEGAGDDGSSGRGPDPSG